MQIRVSVANLATRIILTETDQTYVFGIINRKALEQGDRVATGLGGGAQVTQIGKKFLEDNFGAHFPDNMEARFLVDKKHMKKVLAIFKSRKASMYEIDPTREIFEELSTKELPIQSSPILSCDEAALIKTRYIKTIIQPLGSTRRLARDIPGVPTVRVFNIFELIAEKEIFAKIIDSPIIYTFTPKELRDMRSGKKVRVADGTRMGENIF